MLTYKEQAQLDYDKMASTAVPNKIGIYRLLLDTVEGDDVYVEALGPYLDECRVLLSWGPPQDTRLCLYTYRYRDLESALWGAARILRLWRDDSPLKKNWCKEISEYVRKETAQKNQNTKGSIQ